MNTPIRQGAVGPGGVLRGEAQLGEALWNELLLCGEDVLVRGNPCKRIIEQRLGPASFLFALEIPHGG